MANQLFERDRDSGKEIPHKETFPIVESLMKSRLAVLYLFACNINPGVSEKISHFLPDIEPVYMSEKN